MPNSILILHCYTTQDSTLPQQDSYVHIENGMIASTGAMTGLGDITADLVIDGTGMLLIPGLINGHNHSPMTLFRGLADDLTLHDWLHDHIFPAEKNHVSEEMVYWCSKLAAAEMLLSGTTCVADAYFHSGQTARAFSDAGIRALVAHGILDFPAPGIPDPKKNIETVEQFITRWRGVDQLITPGVFAHSPYTCSPSTLKKAKDLADRTGVRFFIHLAESANEQKMLIEPQGATPLQHLNTLGILDSNCVLVHAVWLDEEDLDIVAATKAHVVVCPQSNFKLASGKAPVQELLKRGVAPGLGTDGCASNNSMDMFREMDMYAKSQKAFSGSPTVLPAELALSTATSVNNRILGLPHPPAVTAGSRADLVLLDLNRPNLTPFYNPDLLVYAAKGSDVDTVIVAGQVVVKKKEIVSFDLEETKMHVLELSGQLSASRPASPIS